MSCPICLTDVKQLTKLSCKHQFCHTCINKWKKEKNQCPLCRIPIQKPHTYNLRPRRQSNLRPRRQSNLIDEDNLPDDFHFNQFLLNQELINEQRITRTSTDRLRFRFIAEEIKYYSKQLSLARERDDVLTIQVSYIDHVIKVVKHNKSLLKKNRRVARIIREKIHFWLNHDKEYVREKAREWKFILEN
tara:strand:- start:8503 stop:9069 length:567 start_codon:yes stop_codon:yes gene_type:complete